MRYFVIAEDGNKYGPADVASLNTWIQEGRLLPTSLLEEEGSGARIAASGLSGLNFPGAGPSSPQTGPYANPGPGPTSGPFATQNPGPASNPYQQQPGAGYARPNAYGPTDTGNGENIAAWVLGGIGLVACCCFGWVLAAIGVFFGYRAKEKGHRAGQAAFIFNIVVVVLSLGWLILSQTILKSYAEQWTQQLQRQQDMRQRPFEPGQTPFSGGTTGDANPAPQGTAGGGTTTAGFSGVTAGGDPPAATTG